MRIEIDGVPLTIRGEHDEGTIAQMGNCLRVGAVGGALCADGHKGYAQPVGGVTAYRGKVSLSGVGYDIACGNMAVRLDVTYSDIRDRIHDIGAEIAKTVSFGVGRHNEERVDHALFDDDPAWSIKEIAALKDLARSQLGTVGSGNHYVDVFRSETDDHVWIGVHFGSRGLGHKVTTHFMKAAGGKEGMDVDPVILDETSDIGMQYLMGMHLGGRYAYAGREWVVDRVRRIIGGEITDAVHNHHNFAWKERHGGEDLWVVRKGATPAFPDQRGFVGGSMGDISVILRGKASEAGAGLFHSTVHGSGRVMSRTQAAGKKRWIGGKPVRVSTGAVDEDQMRRDVAGQGVLLFGAGADEAPQVYRPLRKVLDAHADTIEIETVLRPLVVVMAGADEVDPYKD
jgi:tRNA-splicing ligase RtcB